MNTLNVDTLIDAVLDQDTALYSGPRDIMDSWQVHVSRLPDVGKKQSWYAYCGWAFHHWLVFAPTESKLKWGIHKAFREAKQRPFNA